MRLRKSVEVDMGLPKDKIVFDTNILISLLIRGGFSIVFKLIETGQISILLSIELIDEFLEVSKRPKFQKYFSSSVRDSILSYLLKNGDLIEVNSKPNDCRDPKDNFLLGLAIDGNATHLVTGDKDLLELNPYRSIEIHTLTDFLNLYKD
jgi:putative PIN family toxin of toxin-antitoxin system